MSSPNSLGSSKPFLELQDLAWAPPGSEDNLWEGVSFRLERGELVLLSGESGSGKSTLLRSIVLLEETTAGTVWWRGERVSAENVRRFRNRVVYVHQSPVSIAPTVGENLAFPRRVGEELGDKRSVLSENEQRSLLKDFGLGDVDFSRRLEDFSVGEQQRLALVRCVTVRPEALLLDEPTASLDEKSTHQVERFIGEILIKEMGCAVIWVTHGNQQQERLGGEIIDMNQWVVTQ